MSIINNDVRDKLENQAGYSIADINAMEASNTLVDLLNDFDGTFERKLGYNGAFHDNGKIVLGDPPYNSFSTLAHELGHATGDYQASHPNASEYIFFDKYSSAREYADERERGEGEAIYYEVKVGEELNPSGYSKNSLMWYDNATSSQGESYTVRIKSLMATYSGEELYNQLAKVNAEMVASGGSGAIRLTYDEGNIIDYLEKRNGLGDLNADYKEVMGVNLYTLKDGYPDSSSFTDVVHVKSLTNKSNGHYGENDDDILTNTHTGGTALAQINNGDLLYGGNGNDTLTGNSGKDILLGGEGNDTIYGSDGNDILGGNKDNDTLNGGDGIDILIGGTGIDTLYGDAEQDTLILGVGSVGDSKSTIETKATEDTNENFGYGGEGNDTIYGADGKDTIYTGTTNENSDAGTTNYAYGFKGDDAITGGAGTDFIYGGAGDDTIKGGKGDDSLRGEENDDTIDGGDGEDIIYGNTGTDTIYGGGDKDIIYGNSGGDIIDGGKGDDTIYGDDEGAIAGLYGNDTLIGGAGADTIYGGKGNDVLYGGERLTFGRDSNAQNELHGGEGNDKLYGSGRLEGGKDFDTYFAYDTAVIKDEDGLGKVHIDIDGSSTLATGGTHKLGADDNTYQSVDGKITYVWDKEAKTLKVNDGLTIEDWENGELGINLTAGQDIAFVVDTTGSMGDEIDAVKANANAIIDMLFASNRGMSDSRVAVVGYNDPSTQVFTQFTNQTTLEERKSVAKSAINSLSANDGGDLPEMLYKGLLTALNGSAGEWREDAQVKRIFLFGDAPGKDGHLASQVYQLAGVLGVSVRSMGMTRAHSEDIGVTTFSLENPINEKPPIKVEIYTILLGSESTASGQFSDISNTTGGQFIGNSNATNIANQLYDLIQTGTKYDDISIGNENNNSYYGYDGNDNLTGLGGDDILDGGRGEDTMIGGQGNDTYYVDNANDKVIENVNEGTDTINASFDYMLADDSNIENLTLTGTATTGTGNNIDNIITGNELDNILDGKAGNDTLIGGQGNDTYYVDNVNDKVIESANEGIDTIYASHDYTLADNSDIENLKLTGTATIGTGNNIDNTITGNELDNIFDGKAGNDTLIGGQGNDTYYVDNANDEVIENVNEGTDTINASFDYMLADDSNIENLTLTGTATTGTGNNIDNIITGNELDNILDGKAGNDTLIGGQGNDTYYVDNINDKVIENANEGIDTIYASHDYTLADNSDIENLKLTGTATIGTGNNIDNTITGNELDNILDGKAGNDTLIGGIGEDTMIGGKGNDTYYVDNTNDKVIENPNEGYDAIFIENSFDLEGSNLEEVHLKGSGDFTATGDAGTNGLYGNAGDNHLDGKAGADIMSGGAGNDYYIVDQYDSLITNEDGTTEMKLGDQVAEGFLNGSFVSGDTGGIDTIEQWDDHRFYRQDENSNWTDTGSYHLLQTNVENLILKGQAKTAFGNELDNSITLNEQSNFVNGLGGNDTIIYSKGGGQDTLNVTDNITAIDTLVIEGYQQAETFFTKEQDSLLVRFSDSDDHIWIHNYFLEGNTENGITTDNKVDNIIFRNNEQEVILTQSDIDNAIIDRNDNHAPTINKYPQNITVADDETISVQLDADTITDQDAWDSELTYNITTVDKQPLPNWLTFDPETLTLSGTPSPDEVGTHQFVIWGTDLFDNGAGAYITITVNSSEAESDNSTGSYTNTVEGTEDSEQLLGSYENDLINALAGDDQVFGFSGNDTINGGSGNDYLAGGNGSGTGSGHDILNGGEGNDQLTGEDGNDTLIGGVGDDSYIYTANQGIDTIDNTGGGTDRIFFNNIAENQLSYHQDGNDLVILVDGDINQQVRILEHFNSDEMAIDYIVPSSGYVIYANTIEQQLTAMPDSETETGNEENPTNPDSDGDNTGTDNESPTDLSGDNTIKDTLGNDTLQGGAGNDTYLYTGGQDTLTDSQGVDKLIFSNGITYNQVGSGLMMSGNDLILRVDGNSSNQITLTNYFSDYDSIIETIAFETGGSISHTQIFNLFGVAIPADNSTTEPTPEPILITGDSDLIGTEANDTLQGSTNSDRLQGLSGNDILEAKAGNDILIAGAGNDSLIGGEGNDLYYINKGFGNDTIINTGGGIDNIYFDGLAFNEVASGLQKDGNDLILNISNSTDSLTLKDFFMGGEHAELNISFAAEPYGISAEQLFGAFGESNPDNSGSHSQAEYQSSLGTMLGLMDAFDNHASGGASVI